MSGDDRKSGSGSDESGEEDNYEVEEIRDKRRGEEGEWLYYVKWVGWESDTNTWEPVEHLQDSKDILREFESKWKRKQERKEERRREERERKIKERRERELKAAARFGRVDSDSDGGGGGAANDYIRKHKEKKEKKKERSPSESEDSGEEKKRREERRQKKKEQREKEREKEKKPNGAGGSREEERRKSKDEEKEKKKEPVKPKYFRDIKPEKILGVTTGPGELYFYIQWEEKAGVEPGLVTAKEAYSKIPQMCLKYYEANLFWNKRAETVTLKKEEVKENGDVKSVTDTQTSEVKEGASTSKDEKSVVDSKDDKPPVNKDDKPPVSKDDKPPVEKERKPSGEKKEDKSPIDKESTTAPKEPQEKVNTASDPVKSESCKDPPPSDAT